VVCCPVAQTCERVVLPPMSCHALVFYSHVRSSSIRTCARLLFAPFAPCGSQACSNAQFASADCGLYHLWCNTNHPSFWLVTGGFLSKLRVVLGRQVLFYFLAFSLEETTVPLNIGDVLWACYIKRWSAANRLCSAKCLRPVTSRIRSVVISTH
jgi:hypothetical protein